MFTKILDSIFVLFIWSIPGLLYLGARDLLNPEGFFAEFFVFGVGVWLLGGVFLILSLVCIILLFGVWNSKS
jgi:hypothetical protein